MTKFKRGILQVNFKPYLMSIINIHIHLTRFSETNYYLPRLNNIYGSKSGVGNLSSRRARVTEENSSRATL